MYCILRLLSPAAVGGTVLLQAVMVQQQDTWQCTAAQDGPTGIANGTYGHNV